MTEKTNDYCGRASGRSSATKQREANEIEEFH